MITYKAASMEIRANSLDSSLILSVYLVTKLYKYLHFHIPKLHFIVSNFIAIVIY